jgi:hypothetical protein
MDFIHRPKSKILKIKNLLEIKITTFRKLALLPRSSEWRGKREEHVVHLEQVGVLVSPSIHLRKEAEPASETL